MNEILERVEPGAYLSSRMTSSRNGVCVEEERKKKVLHRCITVFFIFLTYQSEEG